MNKIDKTIKHLQDKIKYETEIYESNFNDPRLSYTEHERGLWVGLIRGLTHAISYLQFVKKGGHKNDRI